MVITEYFKMSLVFFCYVYIAVHGLTSTALVFFFVKCASGNFHILNAVKNKLCL